MRKTGIGRLLDSDLPETFVAQHEGMKCTDSLKSYKAPGEKHKLKISQALDRLPAESSSSTITKPTNPLVDNTQEMVHNAHSNQNFLQLSQVTNIQNNRPNLLASVLTPGSFSSCKDCTFNFNFGEKENSSRRPEKRRYQFLSSDEED